MLLLLASRNIFNKTFAEPWVTEIVIFNQWAEKTSSAIHGLMEVLLKVTEL